MKHETDKFFQNQHGILILRCCATCQHKTDTRTQDARRCTRGHTPSEDCQDYTPLGPQKLWKQGCTILHAGNGLGRVQSPAYIQWKLQNYDEILKRHDGNETFSRFWRRVHELYEREMGLSVYVRM